MGANGRRAAGFVQTLNHDQKVITGTFFPNSTSALDATKFIGLGWTAVRTSAGLFTVTLADSYNELVAGSCSVGISAASKAAVQFGAIDVVTAKTVQIRAVDSTTGLVADIAANAANRISFRLKLLTSAIPQ
jgi:hypothetical protein